MRLYLKDQHLKMLSHCLITQRKWAIFFCFFCFFALMSELVWKVILFLCQYIVKTGAEPFREKKIEILIEIAIIRQYSLCDEFEHLPLEMQCKSKLIYTIFRCKDENITSFRSVMPLDSCNRTTLAGPTCLHPQTVRFTSAFSVLDCKSLLTPNTPSNKTQFLAHCCLISQFLSIFCFSW